ncbi:MAG: SPASM domain-containing protein [Ignavibacteria bacterium]|nr:SPASM domain-containing protein [Ignavibacteria bacterium]
MKRSRASKTIIGIRLMIRPSTRSREREYLRAWSPLCDVIFAQYVSKPSILTDGEDMYTSSHELLGTTPHCSYPSRAMQIKADGSVPLCGINGHSPKDSAIMLGNILDSGIEELWKHPILSRYREAHGARVEALMPVCRGCPGA